MTHFIRTITTIAVSAAFATIAEPMIRKRILSSEELRIVLQRAAMNEEIADGEISVQDIQQILLNEYSLKVINVSGCGATSFLRNSDKIYEKKRNASQAPGRRFWPSAAARTRTRSWRPLWTRWWPPGSLIVRSVGWRWTTRPTPCDCYCSKWGGM